MWPWLLSIYYRIESASAIKSRLEVLLVCRSTIELKDGEPKALDGGLWRLSSRSTIELKGDFEKCLSCYSEGCRSTIELKEQYS